MILNRIYTATRPERAPKQLHVLRLKDAPLASALATRLLGQRCSSDVEHPHTLGALNLAGLPQEHLRLLQLGLVLRAVKVVLTVKRHLRQVLERAPPDRPPAKRPAATTGRTESLFSPPGEVALLNGG